MQAKLLEQQQRQAEEVERARAEQRSLREAAERQQAELARQAQSHASQMQEAMEARQREMDAEFAQRQRTQINRLSSSTTHLLSEGFAGVSGLLYRFNAWKVAVREEQEERQAAAEHRERVDAERRQLQAAMDAKQTEVEKQIAAQQQQYEEKLAAMQEQHVAESTRKSEQLARQ